MLLLPFGLSAQLSHEISTNLIGMLADEATFIYEAIPTPKTGFQAYAGYSGDDLSLTTIDNCGRLICNFEINSFFRKQLLFGFFYKR